MIIDRKIQIKPIQSTTVEAKSVCFTIPQLQQISAFCVITEINTIHHQTIWTRGDLVQVD
jgi:hypothetical protein